MLETSCGTCGRIFGTEKDYLTNTSRFRICSEKNLWFDCSCRSSLMIPEGEYEWYTPAYGMRPKTATIFQTVKEIGHIPLISHQTLKIIKTISDTSTSSREIEQELKQVPPLIFETLKIANNLKVGDGQKISSISHAVSFIGRQALSDLVLAASMKSFYFQTTKFSYSLFWRESSIAGYVGEYLVRELAPHLEREQAYLTSSLCDIGKIVQAICFPELTDRIYTIIQDPKSSLSWTQAEAQVGIYNHCTLGEIAGSMWGFPSYMMQSIMGHHTPAENVREECAESIFFFDEPSDPTLTTQKIALNEIVALAQIYKHWVLLQPSRIDTNLYHSYLKKCHLSIEAGDSLGERVCDYVHQQEID